MRVVFSNRAYASVLAETTEKIKTETGGLFLGTVQGDTWYIIEAIDPGPKSIFEVAYFEYDQKYTQHLINKIANLYDTKLSLIGLWHRHPGSFDQFSSTDDGTNAKYASMRKEGAISALVNLDPSFRITMYQVCRPCRYKRIAYEVGDNLIPDGLLKFKSPDKFFSIMDGILRKPEAVGVSSGEYHRSVSLASFMNFIQAQMQPFECKDVDVCDLNDNAPVQERLIDAVVEDLTFMADVLGIETSILLEDKYLTVYQEAIDATTKLYFTFSTQRQFIILSYAGKCYSYQRNLFADSFRKAKAERDKEVQRNASNVVGSVIRIIGLNKNEEQQNGD